ncbi:MAG: ribonuclease H-like domain-containing protein [Candidatus Weimeria sp.]
MIKTQREFDFNEKIKYPEIVRKYLNAGDMVFTIETTGLSPDRHRIISVSAAGLGENSSVIQTETFFSENKDDELNIIEAALKKIKSASRIITWNGTVFDLKFLSKRCEVYAKKLVYNNSSVRSGSTDIPLYDLSKLLHPIRRLIKDESLSIYTLLEEMGLSDTTLPDGRTVTTLYKTWENTDEKKYAEPIIDHSVYKLTGIINLLSLLNCLEISRIKPEITSITAFAGRNTGSDDSDAGNTDCITASGITDIFTPVPLTFTLPGIHLTFVKNTINCVFDTTDGRIRIYYADAASYVRLKESGQLIPKELAGSMPKDSYEKVTRETCYTLSALPDDTDKARKQLEGYIRQLVLM